MAKSSGPKLNHLLATLRASDYARLLPELEPVRMVLGDSVYERGVQMDYVYFPTTCMISLLYVMKNGDSAEIAVVGNDGLAGVAVFMGGDAMSNRAVVQCAGECYRLTAKIMRAEFALGGSLQHLALRFTQALMAQMVQTGACNRHHLLDQQLCRWLLLTLDRLPGAKVTMTQQLIGNMLGVRRAGVVEAMDRLAVSGALRYTGGNITVLNRGKLEKLSCECYGVVKNEIRRLFAYALPPQSAPKPKLAVVAS